ncbi:MAG TPA: 2-succinyl-5-enolpyruvyl-6-hydroxy-3-cyclohexene-1-carboxylic-acid synthase [Williamwhitmania sp.]|nr:2-succinyl-5-enolpyruvyl-6-hydroxy-3-cyclohexene-1-carboxylic-acid synthase [Williamwhitmania sp.]
MSSIRQGIKDLPEICYLHGMEAVVIAPGSRNAPLIAAFTGHGKLECISITDERSAAYFALGMALQTGKPVGIVCTSGTAVLNFAPAIAEAYYQKLPLVVITADRPHERVDQADSQTIRQTNIFGNYIKHSVELPVETASDTDLRYSHRLVNEALRAALRADRGPVHINVPLREPLYNPLPEVSQNIMVVEASEPELLLPEEEINLLITRWQAAQKKLIICGFESKNGGLNELLNQLADDPSVVVMAENISNISGEKIIFAPERFIATLTDDEKRDFQPDLLVTIGDSLVSGRVKKYLRQHKPVEHWRIHRTEEMVDTYDSLTHSIVTEPTLLLHHFVGKDVQAESGYASRAAEKETTIRHHHEKLLPTLPFCDFTAFDELLKNLPDGSNLQLSNSTPIRYSQLYATNPQISYHCNRGTSGIDGCLSTAAGAAYAGKQPTTLITGDLAFIYDSNGMWNRQFPSNLKVIVINNGGGNIFRLIESGETMQAARPYFETPHSVDLKSLVSAFGIAFSSCSNMEQFREGIQWLYSNGNNPAVLEVKTDFDINIKTFKDYYKLIRQAQ